MSLKGILTTGVIALVTVMAYDKYGKGGIKLPGRV